MLIDAGVFRPRRSRRLHREQLHARLVEQQLEIVRLGKTLDVLVAVSHQPNLNLVLAVHRKGVVDDRAAASADRQALEMCPPASGPAAS